MSAFAASVIRHKVAPMRPFLLDPLFAPATTLDGVGPRLAGLIANVVRCGSATSCSCCQIR
jgi:ATP-dependent DNA helicase RecG